MDRKKLRCFIPMLFTCSQEKVGYINKYIGEKCVVTGAEGQTKQSHSCAIIYMIVYHFPVYTTARNFKQFYTTLLNVCLVKNV